MTIKDIVFTEDALYDYTKAPGFVQKAMDKLVRLMLDGQQFPRSMNVHSAKSTYNDIYIGYVTRTRQHWRILFETDFEKVVVLRLLDHDQADHYLDQYV